MAMEQDTRRVVDPLNFIPPKRVAPDTPLHPSVITVIMISSYICDGRLEIKIVLNSKWTTTINVFYIGICTRCGQCNGLVPGQCILYTFFLGGDNYKLAWILFYTGR